MLSLCLSGCSGSNSGTTPTSPTPGTSTPVAYTPLGASDAAGGGASVPCLPLATSCRDSTGYVGLVQRRLSESRTVSLLNLALPGGVLSPDVEALGDDLGRNIPGNFLAHLAPLVPPATTLVTIFAGGNDTNTIASAIGAGRGGTDPSGYLTQQVQGFARDYGRLIDAVRARAPGAFIVVMNTPNFGALPYMAGRPVEDRRIVQDVSVRLTREAINPLASRVPVVDLMCDARSYQPGMYSADGFHPNDQGHAYLSEVLLQAITTGSAPAPAGSCGFMTIAG
ncbi:SGNH/GDSL hydrolase family protein [Luteitalea pratensis]|uniref:SGNH/GDSL hydrolase family protein n=1 Tax=Luteitalea pratensis TaxID=1855912 RepID=UPI0012FFA2C8|nr:SGNH/GDSL hydrolase family protein [Luteitalea pratensis]